jgi:hypothetical protein
MNLMEAPGCGAPVNVCVVLQDYLSAKENQT